MIKRNIKILVILMLVVLLTGCYSKENKELAKQYRNQGKINALNYIKEKYGFSAKVKSVEVKKSCSDLLPIPTNCIPSEIVTVKLEANKKIFSVYITGKVESTDAFDDYQIDEIEKELIKFLKNNISIDLYDYKLEFNSKGIKEYYNNNLKDMLPYVQNIELYYIGQNNLDTLNLNIVENFWRNTSVSLDLINFKSKRNCEDYKKAEIENVSILSNDMKNIYKDSMISLKNGQRNFYKYDNISGYNNEVYVYYYKDNNIPFISTSKLDSLDYYRTLYTDLNDTKIEQVTNAYSIPKSSSPLYIYFSKEKVKAKGQDKLFYASECYVNGEKKYYIDNYFGLDSNIKIGSVGDYYINLENFSYCDSEVTFALLKISK